MFTNITALTNTELNHLLGLPAECECGAETHWTYSVGGAASEALCPRCAEAAHELYAETHDGFGPDYHA